jgi:hypothetical protein
MSANLDRFIEKKKSSKYKTVLPLEFRTVITMVAELWIILV